MMKEYEELGINTSLIKMPNPITSENLPKEKSEDPKTPSPETLNNTKCIFSFLEITVQHQGPAIIIESEHDDNNQDNQPNNPGDEDKDTETPAPEHNNDGQDGQPDTNEEEDAPPEQENFPPIMPKEPSNEEGDAPPPEQEIHPPFTPKEPPNENHTNNKVPAPPDKDRNTDLTLDIKALGIDNISSIQQANTDKDRNGPTIKEPPQQGRPHHNTQKRNYKEYGGGKIQKPNRKAQQSYGCASLSKALKAQTEFDQRTPSRKAGGCLTFLLHSTECSTETKGKEKEKGERANKVRFKTFFICSQRREREKREREEKTPMFK